MCRHINGILSHITRGVCFNRGKSKGEIWRGFFCEVYLQVSSNVCLSVMNSYCSIHKVYVPKKSKQLGLKIFNHSFGNSKLRVITGSYPEIFNDRK